MTLTRKNLGTLALTAVFTVVGAIGLSTYAPIAQAIAPASDFNWTLVAGNAGPTRCYGTVTAYNPANDTMVLMGGAACTSGTYGDTWWLVGASGPTPTWVPAPVGGGPGRSNHSAAYDAATDTLMVFGGCMANCTPTANDTWLLLSATGMFGPPSWAPLGAAGAPSGRQGQKTFYDPNTNRMIMFGGQNGGGSACCGQLSHDTWVLTNANGTGGPAVWSMLAPTGGPPPGSYYPAGHYDPTTNTLTVTLGGDDNAVMHNAVWILSNANGLGGAPVWSQAVADGMPGSPSARFGTAHASDLANNRLIIYGGSGVNTDTWVLSNANGSGAPTWSQLTTSGGPPTVGIHAYAGYMATPNMLLVFTNNVGNTLNETWRLTNANGIVPPPPPPPTTTVAAAAKAKFAKTPINIKTKGRTPMTVFGSATFAVADIDDSSVTFGANGTESPQVPGTAKTALINKDNYPDRIFYFQKSPTATPCGTTTVRIKGNLLPSGSFQGSDSIKITPCQGGGG